MHTLRRGTHAVRPSLGRSPGGDDPVARDAMPRIPGRVRWSLLRPCASSEGRPGDSPCSSRAYDTRAYAAAAGLIAAIRSKASNAASYSPRSMWASPMTPPDQGVVYSHGPTAFRFAKRVREAVLREIGRRQHAAGVVAIAVARQHVEQDALGLSGETRIAGDACLAQQRICQRHCGRHVVGSPRDLLAHRRDGPLEFRSDVVRWSVPREGRDAPRWGGRAASRQRSDDDGDARSGDRATRVQRVPQTSRPSSGPMRRQNIEVEKWLEIESERRFARQASDVAGPVSVRTSRTSPRTPV
jgi:hypothetical protein